MPDRKRSRVVLQQQGDDGSWVSQGYANDTRQAAKMALDLGAGKYRTLRELSIFEVSMEEVTVPVIKDT